MADIFDLPRDQFEAACKAKASGIGSPEAIILGGLAQLTMPPEDVGIAEDLTRDGFWESWVTLCLARLITPGMVCWNVGANVGYYAALMVLRAGPAGRVLAFEPNFKVWSCLCDMRVAPTPVDSLSTPFSLSPIYLAVSNECDADGRLFVTGNQNLNASLFGGGPGIKALPVAVTTLHQMNRGGPSPDIIFCDAEGAEERIFLGSSLFDTCRPIVSLEFTPSKYQAPRALLAFFRDLGYESYGAGFDGKLYRMDGETLVRKNEWAQMFFLPEHHPWRTYAKQSETRHHGG